jgi:muramidase (phage lysozyme)
VVASVIRKAPVTAIRWQLLVGGEDFRALAAQPYAILVLSANGTCQCIDAAGTIATLDEQGIRPLSPERIGTVSGTIYALF